MGPPEFGVAAWGYEIVGPSGGETYCGAGVETSAFSELPTGLSPLEACSFWPCSLLETFSGLRMATFVALGGAKIGAPV